MRSSKFLWERSATYRAERGSALLSKGTGSAASRILWAASSSVWCRRDNGKWGPNYANVAGNLIGSAIARAYYPSERNVSDTITDGLTVSAEGIVGAEAIDSGRILRVITSARHAEDGAPGCREQCEGRDSGDG